VFDNLAAVVDRLLHIDLPVAPSTEATRTAIQKKK